MELHSTVVRAGAVQQDQSDKYKDQNGNQQRIVKCPLLPGTLQYTFTPYNRFTSSLNLSPRSS